MSAYTVHNEHIRTLIWAGQNFGRPHEPLTWIAPKTPAYPETLTVTELATHRQLTTDTAESIGQILLDTNVTSVNYRYDENEPCVYDHGTPAHTQWTAVEILSAISCYEYQACEHPEWTTSEAKTIIEALRDRLISTLPGYSDGPWEITPDTKPYAVTRREELRAQMAQDHETSRYLHSLTNPHTK